MGSLDSQQKTMSVLIDLLGLVPNTSAIIRLKLVIAGIGAVVAGGVVMGMEGFLLQGCGIAACGAALTVIAVSRLGSTAPDNKGRVTLHTRTPGSSPRDFHRASTIGSIRMRRSTWTR